MLKVKDNVDLKELEKFGFKKHKRDSYGVVCSKWIREICYGDSGDYPTNLNDYYFQFYSLIDIIPNPRGEKLLYFNLYYTEHRYKLVDILYDLVQADFIEKVEE